MKLRLPPKDRPTQTALGDKRSSYALIILSLLRTVNHHVKKSPLNLWFIQWEKRMKRTQSSLPVQHWGHFVGALLWSNTIAIAEKSMGLNHWESDCDTQVKWGWQNQHMGLDNLSSYLQCPNVIPTSGFVHLQSQVRGTFWPGNLAECRSADLDS